MSSLSISNNKEISSIVENETTSIVIDNLTVVGVCNYSITKTSYYPDGSIVRETRYYTSYAVSLEDCQNQAKAKLTMLQDGAPF
jgi:uncharacterized Zn-finger protein